MSATANVRNHALVCALALLCTIFSTSPAQAEDAYEIGSAAPLGAPQADLHKTPKITPEYRHDTLLSLRDAALSPVVAGKRGHFERIPAISLGFETDGA